MCFAAICRPASSTVISSWSTPTLPNFASMSVDSEYGTSVSAVPWNQHCRRIFCCDISDGAVYG